MQNYHNVNISSLMSQEVWKIWIRIYIIQKENLHKEKALWSDIYRTMHKFLKDDQLKFRKFKTFSSAKEWIQLIRR